MAVIFWDASAHIKRYFPERGDSVVDVVFAEATLSDQMATTPWGYAETYSLLLRRYNGGSLDLQTWMAQVSSLQAEVVTSQTFDLFPITSTEVFASIALMRIHNLNATDAAILTVLLGYARSPGAARCLLIASDQRLIRAAQVEGLATLNPEQVTPADVPGLLSALA